MIQIGAILTFGVILGLFYLVREKGTLTSKALWIPVFWFLIVFSRPVTTWLQLHRNVTIETQYVESSPVDAACFGLLIVAGALVMNQRGRALTRFLQFNYPILLYFFYCGLSIAWSDDPVITLKRWTKAVGELLIILVVLTDPSPVVAIRRVFTRVGFVLIPLSFFCIYIYPSMGTLYDASDGKTIYFGVCTWKNQLGLLCMVCGLTSLLRFLEAFGNPTFENRNSQLVAHGAIFVMSAWLIVKADAMTSFACFAIVGGVIVMSTQQWVIRQRRAVFALVATSLGITLFALFIDTTGALLESIGRNSTLTGRTQIWAAVLAQHINPILGTGFESFWMGSRMRSVWDMSQLGIEEAHNGYLEMYLNLGWVGLVLLGLLIVSGYRNATELFHLDPQAGRFRVAFFTCGLIFSCTEAGFRMLTPTWITFLMAIILVPGKGSNTSEYKVRFPLLLGISNRHMRILQ